MTDDEFRRLCNVYGFAPSRSLRELLDTAIAQARLDEREACAKLCEAEGQRIDASWTSCAAALRARGRE